MSKNNKTYIPDEEKAKERFCADAEGVTVECTSEEQRKLLEELKMRMEREEQ